MQIKSYRKAKGYTQEQMADMLGVTQGTYSKKEKGLSGFTVEELLLLEEILQASISELFEDIKKTLIKKKLY